MVKDHGSSEGDASDRKEQLSKKAKDETQQTLERNPYLMGKRRFIGLLSSLGVSGLSLSYLSQENAAAKTDNPKKEIPITSYIVSKEYSDADQEEPVVETVPREEWAEIIAAEKLSKDIKKEVVSQTEYDDIYSGVRTANNGGKEVVVKLISTDLFEIEIDGVTEKVDKSEGGQVKYEYSSTKSPSEEEVQTIREIVSEASQSLGTVSIDLGGDTEKVEIPTTVETDKEKLIGKFDDKYRPVVGGIEQRVYVRRSPYHTHGTTCSTAGWGYMLTAGHNFDLPSDDRNYRRVHQPSHGATGNFVGERDEVIFEQVNDTVRRDAATWIVEDDIRVQQCIASEGGGCRGAFYSIVTEDKIKSEVGNLSYTMEKQGTATGRTDGHITEWEPDWNNVTISADSDKGDSGGPMYVDPEDHNPYSLAGLAFANPENGRTRGMSIEWVLDEFGLSLS